jgi:hypothetical protein
MAAWLAEPSPVDDAHVVVGWLEETVGRRLVAGSALYDRSGTLQGFSRQTWIQLAGAGGPR